MTFYVSLKANVMTPFVIVTIPEALWLDLRGFSISLMGLIIAVVPISIGNKILVS